MDYGMFSPHLLVLFGPNIIVAKPRTHLYCRTIFFAFLKYYIDSESNNLNVEDKFQISMHKNE